MELCLFFYIGIRTDSKFLEEEKIPIYLRKTTKFVEKKTRAQMKRRRNNKSANHSLISHARNDNVAKWINNMALKNDQNLYL